MVLLPGVDSFLIRVQWSVLCWRLKVDPLKIFKALPQCISLLSGVIRCTSSHLPLASLNPQLYLLNSGRHAPPARSRLHHGLRTLTRRKLQQPQDFSCFPSPRDRYPMLPHSSVLKIIFHVFCLLLLVLLGRQVKSSHALLAWIEM